MSIETCELITKVTNQRVMGLTLVQLLDMQFIIKQAIRKRLPGDGISIEELAKEFKAMENTRKEHDEAHKRFTPEEMEQIKQLRAEIGKNCTRKTDNE